MIGIRAKTSYLSMVDVHDGGVAWAARSPRGASGKASSFLTRAQVWARAENLYVPGFDRPLMNTGGNFNYLNGVLKTELFHNWDASPFIYTPGPEIKATSPSLTFVSSVTAWTAAAKGSQSAASVSESP